MQAKTHPEVVHQIVTAHGPILGRDVVAKCADVGYANKKSTSAILFNARVRKTLVKDERGMWIMPVEDRNP